jgi:hypothetical protein
MIAGIITSPRWQGPRHDGRGLVDEEPFHMIQLLLHQSLSIKRWTLLIMHNAVLRQGFIEWTHCIHSGLFCKGSSWLKLSRSADASAVALLGQEVVALLLTFVICAAVFISASLKLVLGKRDNYRSWTCFFRGAVVELYLLFTGIVLIALS